VLARSDFLYNDFTLLAVGGDETAGAMVCGRLQ
jgi:hypothetical protein